MHNHPQVVIKTLLEIIKLPFQFRSRWNHEIPLKYIKIISLLTNHGERLGTSIHHQYQSAFCSEL